MKWTVLECDTALQVVRGRKAADPNNPEHQHWIDRLLEARTAAKRAEGRRTITTGGWDLGAA